MKELIFKSRFILILLGVVMTSCNEPLGDIIAHNVWLGFLGLIAIVVLAYWLFKKVL